jgi:hypothetical protein
MEIFIFTLEDYSDYLSGENPEIEGQYFDGLTKAQFDLLVNLVDCADDDYDWI